MKDIIIFGPCGSGKTTLADMIVDELNKILYEGAVRLSLGRKIKEICNSLGYRDRESYQKVGQFFVKEFDQLIWCRSILQGLKTEDAKTTLTPAIVIDDGRQHAEFDYFKPFLKIGIISDTMTRVERIFQRDGVMTTREQLSHDTEQQAKEVFEKCEIRIHNDTTLDELREQAKKIIKILEEEK